jgi:hypothetical protein
MRKYSVLFVIILAIISSCVQKSSKKTIVLKLNVAGEKNIETVGIRGEQKPLSWDYDLELKPIIKDSLYTATYSFVTGYKFTEAKFTINGQFELNDKDNRRIIFSDTDTTVYMAKFNVVNK